MLKNRLVLEKTMKKLRNLLILSLTIVGFLAAGTAAKADSLTINLVSPFQSGPGGVFEFDATVTNNGPDALFINSDSANVDAPAILDDSPFFSGPLTFLGAGDSYTGEFFTVTAPSYGPGSNFYAGSFELLGGADGNATDTLATADFNVQVTPEPSSFLLFGSGLLALGLLTGRKLLA
jgi:PEP-CTERM motif